MYQTEFSNLIEIMDTLLSENGCEWDKAQTHESLRQYLIEEAYETVEAIDNSDMKSLREELGDLMLHIVFHAKLGEEAGNFDIIDILKGINKKLVRRHPHIFNREKEYDLNKVKDHWEELKQSEGRESRLDGTPKTLPALQLAYRLQEKAASTGFDWDDISGVWEKVNEEIKEFKEAAGAANLDATEEEFGDLIFSLVNLSRYLNINPEDALRRSIRKFEFRFKGIEEEARKSGRNLKEMSLKEMDEIWDGLKRKRIL